MTKKINLAVMFGGRSGEHEVSLASASQVIKALDKNKYNIIPIAITKQGNWLVGSKGEEYLKLFSGKAEEDGISKKKSQSLVTIRNEEKSLVNYAEGEVKGKKIDLVLPIMHGPFGEDGKLQGMLEMLGVPYVFSNTLAQALAMNKPKTQLIIKASGLPIPEYITIKQGQKYNLSKVIEKLSLPIVVKPAELGSSVGISIAQTRKQLAPAIKLAFKYGQEVMLERFINGRELTVTVFGNQPLRALPVTEIIPVISEFYDYKAKYQDGGSKHICPAKIPNNVKKKISDYAVRAFKAIGCADLARADFIWDNKKNQLYFLEINTIPGMTSVSLAPEAARVAGINFSKFLDMLINEALRRKSQKKY
jgi:D-alanine-D-alanine ligase